MADNRAMKTRRDIAPNINAQTFRDSVAFLEEAGVITPERPGSGRPMRFNLTDAERLRQFINLVAEGRTRADALACLTLTQSAQAGPTLSTQIDLKSAHVGTSQPQPAGETTAAPAIVESLRQEVESLRSAVASAEAARSEETASLRARLDDAERRATEERDRAATEVAKLRELVRELDEERNNHRARLASMERERRAVPSTWRERIKAAFDVLFGRQVALPVLPAPKPERGEDRLRQAA